MNYKNNALREIQEFTKEFEDYSFGEILYSGIRLLKLKKLTDLHKISDEDIFTAFNSAKELERDAQKATDEDILKIIDK
jgi:hypothetical protein